MRNDASVILDTLIIIILVSMIYVGASWLRSIEGDVRDIEQRQQIIYQDLLYERYRDLGIDITPYPTPTATATGDRS